MTHVELSNPSAFHSLRIYQQDRSRNTFDKAPTAQAVTRKRETRAELELRGSKITMVPQRLTTREGGVLRSVTRDIPTPLWQAEGAESIHEWVTQLLDKMADDARRAPATAAPPVQRVVDTWTEPKPFASIPPHGKLVLPLAEERRFAIECDEEVTLPISNTSNVRTIRLRTRDSKSGEIKTVAHIAPAREYPQAGVVIANGKTAAVIELMPA
jgi:hypothetical protein